MKLNIFHRIILGILLITAGLIIINMSMRVLIGKSSLFLANQFINSGNDLRVESMVNRGLNADPDNKFILFYLGTLYRKQQRWENAAFPLFESLEYSTHPANVLRELGNVYFFNKEYDRAFTFYDKSFNFDIHPSVTPGQIYFHYAKSAFQIKNYSLAIYGAYNSMDLNFSDDYVLPVAVESFLKIKMDERALYLAGNDFIDSPENIDKQQKYFLIFTRNNANYAGSKLFENLFNNNKLNEKGINLYATLLYLDKQFEKSLEILRSEESENSENPGLYLLMAKNYEMLNDKTKSKEYYEKFLEKDPDAPNRQEIENKIKQ